MELRCQQQQEALSVQLEAVEKAAKAERHEQQQFKRNLEREAREQTELKEKTVMDTNQKLSSLQQHYKLLKIEKEDFAEECTKTKAKQLAEIKTLQDKIKSMQIEHEKEINKFKVRPNWSFYVLSKLTPPPSPFSTLFLSTRRTRRATRSIRWWQRTRRSVDCANKSMISIHIVHGDRKILSTRNRWQRQNDQTIKISMPKSQ